MEEKRPEFNLGGNPVWWHHHGIKMGIISQGLCNDYLVLQGSAAELRIEKHRTDWLLTWKIIHSLIRAASGIAVFTSDELLAAFGVNHAYTFLGHSKWLIDRYGGTAACQGCFLRYQDWLNIPCPGTGNDGDPNISILLDEKIDKAVKDLIYRNR